MKTFELKYENWGNYFGCRNRREARRDSAHERKAYGQPSAKELARNMSPRREKKVYDKMNAGGNSAYHTLGRREKKVIDAFWAEELQAIDERMMRFAM